MKKKTLALPVRAVDWSDTSQVLTLFTRELGTVEAIAKGAHRPRNAFQGPFDLGVLWEVVLAERPPERGLAILTEGAIVEGFRGLRRGWASWAAGAYVIEYLRAVSTPGEPSSELFDAAAAALLALSRTGGPAPGAGEGAGIVHALVSFEARALRVLGLSAPVAACAECGRPWSGSDRPVFFCAASGGILCGACRGKEPGRQGVVVPGSAVRALEDLAGRHAASWTDRAPEEGGGAPEGPDRPRGRAAGEAAALSPAGVLPGERRDGGAALNPDPADLRLLPQLAKLTGELRVFYLEHDFKMLKYISNFL